MCEEAWEKRIAVNPKVLKGKPVIAGTRVPVYVVLAELGAGTSIEEVARQFRITEDDVRAALMYAAESVSDEVVHALPSG